MSKTEAIKQLQELIADRESFLHGNDLEDEIYNADIAALNMAVTALEGEDAG